MIIDFHTHIFPDDIRGSREKFFSSEPEFKLLYSPAGSTLAGYDDLLHSMDDHHVNQSVILGFPWKQPELIKRHNDYILEAVTKHPDRFIGFCCADPFHPLALEEIERCRACGIKGVGELAFYQTGLSEKTISVIEPLMAFCHEYHLPVLIHTNEPVGHPYPGKMSGGLKDIDALISRFRKNTLILAHWGGGIFFFMLLKRDMKGKFENVYLDTAASPFLYDPDIYPTAVRIIGSSKIVFGSDYPLLSPSRYVSEIEQTGLSRTDLDRIFGLNALAILQQAKKATGRP